MMFGIERGCYIYYDAFICCSVAGLAVLIMERPWLLYFF